MLEPSGEGREPSSYRDPRGYVFRRDGVLYRCVDRSFAADWDTFDRSGLHAELTERGLLVADEPADASLAPGPDALAVIRPREIPFISYPYEWSFSQLRDAALLTLEAQERALARGMSLRDASAYNIQFLDGRPILIDTLSFARLDERKPWDAYRQFCEHFLAPLALMAYRDVRMAELLRANLEGIPLELASLLLPARTRLSTGLGAHIHLHARSSRSTGHGSAPARAPSMSIVRHRALVDHLRRSVSKLTSPAGPVGWSEYGTTTSYSTRAASSKRRGVEALLDRAGGKVAWDLGANDGTYTALAAAAGLRTIALDRDGLAVEKHYRALRGRDEKLILPLVGDIAAPSPALGWDLRERASLLERADADVVVALALIHHLAIGRNVPLPMIAGLFARLGQSLLIEWVPKDDPQITEMLAFREDIFGGYTEAAFRAALGESFEEVSRIEIDESQRVLYLFSRR